MEVVELLNGGNQGMEPSQRWKHGRGFCNGTVHSFTSNWRELRTVVETLKREEMVFNKSEVGWFFTSRIMKSPTTFARKVPEKPSY
jgi:hypothetical protein